MSVLALTYDDGPDPEWTPRLLDVLAQAGATATFFPIVPRAVAHPALIARILDAGHTVGLHCHEHVRHSDRDHEWLRADTALALDGLSALGVAPTLWRTPWGVATAYTDELACEHELRIVGWTVDTHDWRGDSREQMLSATRSELRAGAIVLAHDGLGPGARRSGAAETVAYTELVAGYARESSLSLKALA
jgi:peptidoglycan/xylan/chitin deacetylase (PgdA/CDA1 family)